MMTDLTIRAVYATVAEADGARFVGFVGMRDETYALFRQPLGGGPVWFELNDEDFGAEDAVETLAPTSTGLLVTLRPALRSRFGYVGTVALRLDRCDGADAARTALAAMGWPELGDKDKEC